MASLLHFVLICALAGLLPLMAQAQAPGPDMFQSQRSTAAPTTLGQDSQVSPPAGSLISPSIGNAQQQRQQRGARTGDDPRNSQFLQPEPRLPLERIEFQDFVAQ